MAGILYLVATPIGNLEDMSFRGVRVLGEVDRIACEDTRQTRKLLEHYDIRTPTVSCHEHNEAARTPELLDLLLGGADIALVSDAGTPLVSDPGHLLVRGAIAEGIAVVPIPGPSAAIAALAGCGLSVEHFCFAGFLPPKRAQRRKQLERLAGIPAALVLYEGPHRLLATLADVSDLLGDRPVVLARELTKIHEEFLRGTAAEIAEELRSRPAVKGESTLIIGPPPDRPKRDIPPEEIKARVERMERQGTPRMDAIKAVAREAGLPKREVYRIVETYS
ncbi:MAG: 16S rRNA (cytidine(1402)-2'-O)-methyltransferase [bacterium]|nr:16S rRNA (cytidine(1402)-2'-O)-methyltransferase [bacterium]